MKTTIYATKGLYIFLLSMLFACASHGQQVANSLQASNGTVIGFYEFKPAGYSSSPEKKYPLIIFLHGIGERGNGTTELPYVLYHGLPKVISQGATMTFTNPNTGQKESFLVLSPQLPKYLGYWDNLYIDEMIKYAKTNLRVDTNKIFLTGLSLGGGGAWAYPNTSVAHARKFAAIAPVCGVCYYNYSTLCSTIGAAGLPVWGFVNADDNVVNPTCTIQACDVLTNCSPGKIKKTVYAYGGHDAWTKAYDTGHSIQNINMYEWFLSNSKTPPATAPNQAPVANAGSPVTITLPLNSVTLNGSASKDPDGSIVAYKWDKVAGPSQFSIANAGTASTSVNNLTEGIYSFQLTVTDDNAASASAIVQVTVSAAPVLPANQPPVVVVGNALNMTLPVDSITLNGSASDADGSISSYLWTLISGPSQVVISTPNTPNTSATGLVAGDYVFRLTASDDAGATGYQDLQVKVNPLLTTTAPVAIAGKDENIPVGQATVLHGENSTCESGKITAYSWTKFSGPDKYQILSPSSSATWIRYMVAGTYIYRLKVTDSNGLSSYDDVVITVYDKNQTATNIAPVAKAGKDTTITLPVNTISLDGSSSVDADGTISAYGWSMISGPSQPVMTGSNAATLQLSNLITGPYVFRLNVTDNSGAAGADTVTVLVNAAITTALPPVANAGKDETIPVGQATVLHGEKSTAPGGTIKSYNWSVKSGPGTYEILSPASYATWIRKMVAGTYVYRLTIVDSNGATSSDDVTITVYQSTASTLAGAMPLKEQDQIFNTSMKAEIYPNPVVNRLQLRMQNTYTGDVNAAIFDMNGKLLRSRSLNKQTLSFQSDIDVSTLQTGSYMIQLSLGNGQVLNEKFMKN